MFLCSKTPIMSKPSDFINEVTQTARIDPSEYAAQTSRSRLSSFGYALAGWLYMLRRQKNTRIMSVASIAALLTGAWLGIRRVEWAILILTITVVWLAEFLNAGIEAAIDAASPEYHPMAKVGKDVASAAVLLTVVAAIIVGILIFGQPLQAKLSIS